MGACGRVVSKEGKVRGTTGRPSTGVCVGKAQGGEKKKVEPSSLPQNLYSKENVYEDQATCGAW